MALGKFKETLLGIKSKVKENKFGRKNKTVVSRKNKRQNLQQLKEEESEARFKKSLKKMKLSSKNFSREEKKRGQRGHSTHVQDDTKGPKAIRAHAPG